MAPSISFNFDHIVYLENKSAVKMAMACDPLEHKSMYEREDSEDSDGEGGLGNINRVLVRPAGHSGKPKKGHLCFDASFETGNLGRVDLISEFEYDLFIRPDTCSPRFRFWFNFTVENYKPDQRVIFNIVNISKSKNLYREFMTPIVKSTSRPKWQRIPKCNVFYHRSAVHQGHHVLTFAFCFDGDEEVFQFAMAPPYSYSRLQLYLDMLESRSGSLLKVGSFTREHIASSVQERKLDLISIGNTPETPSRKEKKRVVVIIARVHPGESPSSFVCQGLLDFMVSNHKIASVLREHVIFKIVPMINPDGVFLGNYRSTLMGFDLNRSWNIASQWGHPTVWAVLNMLRAIDNSECFQLDFVIDIHAHSSLMGAFVYGNTYEDIYRYERHIVFPKLLASNADDYASHNTMYNADVTKAGTARRFLCTALSDQVNSYTLEVSLGGYQIEGSNTIYSYTEESYMRLGRNLIRTFLDYYKLIGIVASSPPKEISSKKRRPQTYRSRSPPSDRFKQRPKTTQRSNATLHFKDLTEQEDLFDNEFETYHYRYPNSLITKRSKHFDETYSNFSHNRSLANDLKGELQTNKPSKGNESVSNTIKLVGGGGFIHRTTVGRHVSPPPQTFILPPPPSLSIIDFNQLTRGGLDQAIGRIENNKIKKNKKKEKPEE